MDIWIVYNAICDDLGICPTIEISRHKGISAYSVADDRIILPEHISQKEMVFSLAHECRHAWQAAYRPQMFENYKNSGFFFDKTEFQRQEAEIDANAYGIVVMAALYGEYPKQRGLDRKTLELTAKRAEEIALKFPAKDFLSPYPLNDLKRSIGEFY